MLRAVDLRKQYSAVLAVDGVSLSAERGQILGLLGPNGAGKTTTIRMLLNIIPPDAGIVTFDGDPFSGKVRNQIGYLPEERGLYRRSRVLNTIRYFAALRGVPEAKALRRAHTWLERLGLSGQGHTRIDELSRGNQQKVQFIISILHEPRYVVLDEPFSGLDPLNQNLLREILAGLKEKGMAVIFSTHVMQHAEELCDTLCLIDGGQVLLDGPLTAIRSRFARQAVNIEFGGDGEILRNLPGIRVVTLTENRAEVILSDPAGSRDLIREINERLLLRKYEQVRPSLDTIFLETVRDRRADAAGITS